jgi:glycerol-3-phosphate acyltransferase PlsY
MNILIIFISYLLGSLPTGFLVGKYLKNIDLRNIGSGSTGATNVLRNVGKWPALFVFIVDVGKGLIAVIIAKELANQDLIDSNQGYMEVLAGISAISGHIWPIWLKGKGGKAVATGLGMFLALSWKVGLASFGIFLLVLAKSKFVSLSSISAAILLPIFMFFYVGNFTNPYFYISLIVALLVIWKHRTNINRLLNGKESKINRN